ncbi:MAG TPA: NAD(P)H-dependent oxidoreductase [Sphingobacterium sp.]|nr:NAD(P)H-dependent oxidoreductase [Sphingobacterium sp.]
MALKAIIFNGALERRAESTSEVLSNYLKEKLEAAEVESQIFTLADSGIPLFDITLQKTPKAVAWMAQQFVEADLHIWLAPLYHGSIPGAMKNALDWLEITANAPKPYLIDKTVGMLCWADGMQAMQGINSMDAIAKSLRAWPLPYSVPIVRSELFKNNEISKRKINPFYQEKLDRLIYIATTRNIEVNHL